MWSNVKYTSMQVSNIQPSLHLVRQLVTHNLVGRKLNLYEKHSFDIVWIPGPQIKRTWTVRTEVYTHRVKDDQVSPKSREIPIFSTQLRG